MGIESKKKHGIATWLRLNFIHILMLLAPLSLSACSALLFFPDEELVRHPSDIGLQYEVLGVPMSDQRVLRGWLLRANGEVKGTILHFHGNAQNISTHIAAVYWLPAQGYNVIMVDYRGFGESEDLADLDAIMSDADDLFDYFAREGEHLITRPLIVYGQSMGGAVATHAVSRHPQLVDGLIVESSFTDFRSIAREKLGDFFLTWPLQWPLSYLFPGNYNSKKAIADIHDIPVLVVHGMKDEVIPFHHGEKLYAAANSPKQFWPIEDGQHIEATTRPEFRQQLVTYLDTIKTRRTKTKSD